MQNSELQRSGLYPRVARRRARAVIFAPDTETDQVIDLCASAEMLGIQMAADERLTPTNAHMFSVRSNPEVIRRGDKQGEVGL